MIYCPLHKFIRKWSDRTKVTEEPLFKGYVFIYIKEYKRDEVFSYAGTVRYLFWLRRLAVIRDEEIATIKKWLGHYDNERLKVTDITPNTNVRITSGKFINEEGILLDNSNFKALAQMKEMGIQLSLDRTQKGLQVLQRQGLKVFSEAK